MEGPATLAFINVMNCPLDFHNEGRIPDGLQQNTIMLVDFLDDNGWTSPTLAAAGSSPITVAGVGAMFNYGPNDVRLNTADIVTTDSRSDAIYGISYFLIGTDGVIFNFTADSLTLKNKKKLSAVRERHYDNSVHIKNPKRASHLSTDVISECSTSKKRSHDDCKEPNLGASNTAYFWSNDPVNIATITGLESSYDMADAIIDQMRVLGAGFNFLPTIEVVTNSDTFAISRYYAAGMTADSLYDCAFNQGDIYTLMREASCYNEYTNAQGCSVRFNPCQKSIITFTEMNQFSNLSAGGAADISAGQSTFPIIVTRFTSSVIVDPGTNFTAPFRSKFRAYFEGVLQLPTPLITTRVPFEPTFEMACKAYVYDVVNYPTTAAGHTFNKVTRQFYRLAASIDPRFGKAVKQGMVIYKTANRLVKAKPKKRKQMVKKATKMVFRKVERKVAGKRKQYVRKLNKQLLAGANTQVNNAGINVSNHLKPDLTAASNGLNMAMAEKARQEHMALYPDVD